jgi:hypothetical protein
MENNGHKKNGVLVRVLVHAFDQNYGLFIHNRIARANQ